MTAVLVVDDDANTRHMLRLVLEDEGYHVMQAADGAAGLAAMRASPSPLVVLLDQLLPAMKGCELLARVKDDPDLRRHAYIVLTATTPSVFQNECGDLAREAGSEVIYKPFHLHQLLQAITAVAARLPAADHKRDQPD